MSTGLRQIAVGVLALGVLLVVGCGSSDEATSDAGSPEDTVQAFYDASVTEDAGAVCLTLSTATQELAGTEPDSCETSFQSTIENGQNDVPTDFSIDSSSIDGDKATVEVTGDGKKQTFNLVNEDGWKLDFTNDVTLPPVG